MNRVYKPLIAVVVGGLLAPYFLWCWAMIAGYGLFVEPALRAGLRGGALHMVLTPIDFLASVVLFLPGAWLLWKLGRDSIFAHVALALVSFFVVSSALVGLPTIAGGLWQILSNILPFVALPLAVLLIAWLSRRAGRNSFTSTSLRGAA